MSFRVFPITQHQLPILSIHDHPFGAFPYDQQTKCVETFNGPAEDRGLERQGRKRGRRHSREVDGSRLQASVDQT
jgi:hypothetical protein